MNVKCKVLFFSSIRSFVFIILQFIQKRAFRQSVIAHTIAIDGVRFIYYSFQRKREKTFFYILHINMLVHKRFSALFHTYTTYTLACSFAQ